MKEKLFIVLVLFLQLAVDAQPQIEWQRVFGGSNYDIILSMDKTTDGGHILAGRSYSNNGDVLFNHGDADLWVVKLNATGTVLWQKSLGGSSFDTAKSIKQTADGGFIVGGETNSSNGDAIGTSYGSDDYWLVKLNAQGDIQWQKRYGGYNFDVLNSVAQTTDGGYIMAGASSYGGGGMVVGNQGGQDAWIVKVNANGTLVWQKSLGGSEEDQATGIVALAEGGYVVTGFTRSTDGDVSVNHGFYDVWVVKLSNNGTIIWEKTYGGSNMEIANCIRQTADGGFVFAGRTSSNDGQVSGNHSIDGGNFFASDFWVVKINGSGILEWQKCLGGFANEQAFDVQQTTDGGYMVCGSAETPANQDGDVTEGTHGGSDFWVVKLSNSGQLQWQKTLGGSAMDYAYAVSQLPDGGFLVVGETSSSDGDVVGMQPNRNSELWAVKLSAENLAAAYFDTWRPVLYPNPTTSTFSIQWPTGAERANITISDNMGKILYKTSDANQVDMTDFAAGLYFVTVASGKNSVTQKIIKK